MIAETNKIDIDGNAEKTVIVSGNGNMININNDKKLQEKSESTKVQPSFEECHQNIAKESRGDDKKQITEIKEIEFVNRINELQFMTNSIYGPPYILIDSPKGYGKTRLMKAVKNELERQNWLCISIDLRENVFSSIGEIASYFLKLLTKEDTPHCNLTHPENAGGEVGKCIIQTLHLLDKKAVLFQIDTVEKLEKYLINDLLTKFIPTFASTIHQTVNIKLKIMFAGFYIARQEYCEIPFKVNQLSPFDFDIVYQSVQHFDSSNSANMKIEYQKDFSAWLMFFTGGHPKSMAEILIKNYRLPMNVITNKEKELYEIVKATIDNIKIHIPAELKDIMERLSVIRRFNARLLKNFIENENKVIEWDGKSEYELENLLCQTYLVSRKDGFLQDGITRRLLAIDLCKNNLKLFIRIYKQTVSFYEERLRDYQVHGRHIIAVEILFQKLQYISCKTKKINIKYFFKYSEEVIKQLVMTKDSISVLYNFIQMLNEDWEFQFMLNYLFREGSYDEKPFKEFMKTIIDFLENLKKGGGNV